MVEMYLFEHEIRRKQKIEKAYLAVFIITVLFNAGSFFYEGLLLRGTLTLLFFTLVFYFRKLTWPNLIIKLMVWVHILLLVLAFAVWTAGLLNRN